MMCIRPNFTNEYFPQISLLLQVRQFQFMDWPEQGGEIYLVKFSHLKKL